MAESAPTTLRDLIKSGQVPALDKLSSSDLKKHLLEGVVPFTITDVKYAADGEFDPFWEVSIQYEDKEGILNFGSQESRDELMEQLSGLVASQPISGVKLEAVKTKKGHTFTTIVAAE